jgi:transposase-like protein
LGGSARVELSDFILKPTEDPMAEENITLTELLQKSGEGDYLRTVAEAVLQILMEADVEGLIGAGRHERSAERLWSDFLKGLVRRGLKGVKLVSSPE